MNRISINDHNGIRVFVSNLFFLVLALSLLLTPPAMAQSGTWSLTGHPNTARTGHTATLLSNGEVLIVGGNGPSGPLTTAELYNPSTGAFSTTGTTATPRYESSAVLLRNGEVLVAGGYLGTSNNVEEFTATAELYNPSTGKWSTTGSMAVPRSLAGIALLANGQALVAGGLNSGYTAIAESELYNPSTGKWTVTGSLPANQDVPMVRLSSGLVLIAGGAGAAVYNPSTGTWTRTSAEYYSGGSGTTIAALRNGNGLIFGNHLVSYTSQFYNPATNVWARTLGQTGTGVNFGPLVALANGNVLLAGGTVVYDGKASATTKAGIYNSSTNTWSITGNLKVAAAHTATLLQGGKVLVVGGIDAELYTP
jgi:N-acetylneuraminic acid mutarotase